MAGAAGGWAGSTGCDHHATTADDFLPSTGVLPPPHRAPAPHQPVPKPACAHSPTISRHQGPENPSDSPYSPYVLPMMSRWISLVPPYTVDTTVERSRRSMPYSVA